MDIDQEESGVVAQTQLLALAVANSAPACTLLKHILALEVTALTARGALFLWSTAAAIDPLAAALAAGLLRASAELIGDHEEQQLLEVRAAALRVLTTLCAEKICAQQFGALGGHLAVLQVIARGAAVGSEPHDDDLDDDAPDDVCAAANCALQIRCAGCVFPMDPAPFQRSAAVSAAARAHVLRYTLPAHPTCRRSDSGSALTAAETASSPTARAAAALAAAHAAAHTASAGEVELTEERRRAVPAVTLLIRGVAARQASQFDVGFVTWPAAVALARWLHANSGLLEGRAVLEVGAGLALAGLAAACHARRVDLSDFNPLVLDAARYNIAINGRERDPSEAHDEYDIIIGADMICQESDAAGVTRALLRHLAPRGVAHFVLPHSRTRYGVEALPAMLHAAGLRYERAEVGRELLEGIEESAYLKWHQYRITR
ncbi:S-adenosyl-L-methionine-dependent methyltransferase [Tribonema minus]|uniref:S-adenosyl-L-methionine-dependent methyltransferase n=1 Tax=Tribonema minus TaxID=303371 RepID=A0A835Z0L9_9STRA|nr:S-adenosyl-L-methionine-dependent methyltransferase [Tribonema minus]